MQSGSSGPVSPPELQPGNKAECGRLYAKASAFAVEQPGGSGDHGPGPLCRPPRKVDDDVLATS